jgi:transcriptional regulator with AAA-type ATPase domain
VELAAKFEVHPSKPCWKQRYRENVPADTPLSVQEEGDVPTIHALMAQWAYITLKQLVYMIPARIAQLYQKFKDDMPGNLRELQNEVDHWKAIRELVNVTEKPDTLDNSINQPRPILQHVHCCHSTDGDVYIDSHGRSPLQRYAASQELSALYNDN